MKTRGSSNLLPDPPVPTLKQSADRIVMWIALPAGSYSERTGLTRCTPVIEGEVLAKQLKRQTAKTVELASLNPEHGDRVLPLAEIAFMARVIWASQ